LRRIGDKAGFRLSTFGFREGRPDSARRGLPKAESRLLAFAVAFCAAAPAPAVPSLESDLSPDHVSPGETAVYTLTVTDAEGGELSYPPFGRLVVRHQSNSMQSVFSFGGGGAGGVRMSRVYTWVLEPPAPGRYELAPATLKFQNQVYRSAPAVLVCEAGAAPAPAPPHAQRPQARPPSVFQDPFGGDDDAGAFPFGFTAPVQPRGEGDVFLRATVDRTEAWLGEQVTLGVYLFSQADVTGVQTLSFPRLDGFWAEDVETPTQLMPEVRTVGGVAYRAYMLRRRALFPLRAGEISIDPIEAQVNLGLALFFGARGETVKRRSVPVKLNVRPLPADGQPPGFDAANVGVWNLEARAGPTSVAAGQPVQLRVTLEGTGNLKGLRLPPPKLPEGLRTYDPTTTEKIRIAGARYGGSRTVEYVIIPERTGRFAIPPVELAYFDPAQGYRTARSQPIVLDVSAPAGPAGAPSAARPDAAGPAGTNVLGAGPRPARAHPSLAARALVPAWDEPWFRPLVAAPPALWLLVWAGGLLIGAVRSRDPVRARARRARGVALRRLRAASRLASEGKAAEFHAEVARALAEFVTDRLGIPATGLVREALAARLKEHGCDPARADALVALLETCENARFAPGASSGAAMDRVHEEARRLVDALDDAPERRAA